MRRNRDSILDKAHEGAENTTYRRGSTDTQGIFVKSLEINDQ